MAVEQALQAQRDMDEARRELAAALAEKGLTLPSLGVDPASCAGPEPRPLLELGRVNLVTARASAVVLLAASAGPEAGR